MLHQTNIESQLCEVFEALSLRCHLPRLNFTCAILKMKKKTISSGKTFHVYFTGFNRVYSIVGEIWLTTPITCFMYFPSIRPWLFIFDTMRVENVAPSMMNTYNCAIGNSQIFWFAIFAIKWTSMERERERGRKKNTNWENRNIIENVKIRSHISNGRYISFTAKCVRQFQCFIPDSVRFQFFCSLSL